MMNIDKPNEKYRIIYGLINLITLTHFVSSAAVQGQFPRALTHPGRRELGQSHVAIAGTGHDMSIAGVWHKLTLQ